MRKLAIILPIAMVGTYMAHEVASGGDNQSQTVLVAEAPVAPVPTVAPVAPVAPVLPVVEVEPVVPTPVIAAAARQGATASVTINLPEFEEFGTELVQELTVNAAAQAEIAASFTGILQALEQIDEGLDEGAVALTGNVLAELAASLEGYIKIETKDGNVVIVADTGRKRQH